MLKLHPKTVEKNTLELQVGDIVWTHQMRVGLVEVCYDGDRHGSNPEHNRVINFRGVVLNYDDVIADDWVPAGYLFGRDSNGQPNGYIDEWHIQGNDLARWAVEVDD